MMRFAPIAFLPLAACVQQAAAPMPLSASGPSEVMLNGVAFIADLQPVAGGAQLAISRQDSAFALDEGLLAKSVAVQLCADRNRDLDPAALGSFRAGLWVFDGGCQ